MPALLLLVLPLVLLSFLWSAYAAPFDVPTDDAAFQPLYTALPAVVVAWGDADHPPRVFTYGAPIESPDALAVAMTFEVQKMNDGGWCATPPRVLDFPFDRLFLSIDSRTIIGVQSDGANGAKVISFHVTSVTTMSDLPDLQLYVVDN